MSLDSRRNHDTESATATSTKGCKQVRIVTSVGFYDFTRCEYDGVFENLVCGEAEVVTCRRVAAALDIASNGADCLNVLLDCVSSVEVRDKRTRSSPPTTI